MDGPWTEEYASRVRAWCDAVGPAVADGLARAGVVADADRAAGIVADELFARLAVHAYPPAPQPAVPVRSLAAGEAVGNGNGHVPHDPAAANGVHPPPHPPAGPTRDQIVDDLVELRRRLPPPDRAEQLADCRWLQEHWIDAELEAYRGTTVVVYGGAVVGHGDDPLRLELDAAHRFGVNPSRFIVEYIPRRGESLLS